MLLLRFAFAFCSVRARPRLKTFKTAARDRQDRLLRPPRRVPTVWCARLALTFLSPRQRAFLHAGEVGVGMGVEGGGWMKGRGGGWMGRWADGTGGAS